jgi:hypothetical protein
MEMERGEEGDKLVGVEWEAYFMLRVVTLTEI